MELLSLTNDVVFKMYFTSPGNDELLIHFLQAVLELQDKIKEVTILNPEIPKTVVDDKGLIVDIMALTEKGERFHVEMQTADHAFFKERISFYNSKAHTTQFKKRRRISRD